MLCHSPTLLRESPQRASDVGATSASFRGAHGDSELLSDLAKVTHGGAGLHGNKGTHSAQAPESMENVLQGPSKQKASHLPRAALGDPQSRPPCPGTSSYRPHRGLSPPLYGLCTLTCVRVGGDVPSFRQYLLTAREGPLFINLLSSKHHDAVAGQARPWVWGPGAVAPCDRSLWRARV